MASVSFFKFFREQIQGFPGFRASVLSFLESSTDRDFDWKDECR